MTTAQQKPTAGAADITASYDALLVDARKITVKLVDINPHFICNICHGYLRDAQAIKECLHTFCNGCILPYFMKSKSNNSCPTCDVSLGVRPWEQLMPDPAIQELTLKILPDYREKEKIDILCTPRTPESPPIGAHNDSFILIQILHLRKYIAKKLGSGIKPEEVEMLCKGVPVGPEYSLEFIRRTIWMDESAKLILEFRRQAT
uniref:RING-type domain-containing protein n=1 Tax=Globisporangium ultimum (strain ATCC 200006 / CBS 805.95 / DAOM BR144) TaxID=431595 RepID=K3X9Q1_GLOUD